MNPSDNNEIGRLVELFTYHRIYVDEPSIDLESRAMENAGRDALTPLREYLVPYRLYIEGIYNPIDLVPYLRQHLAKNLELFKKESGGELAESGTTGFKDPFRLTYTLSASDDQLAKALGDDKVNGTIIGMLALCDNKI